MALSALASRLTAECGGAQIYLKREDLAHTGAHKINNALGQGLLARLPRERAGELVLEIGRLPRVVARRLVIERGEPVIGEQPIDHLT